MFVIENLRLCSSAEARVFLNLL